MTDWRTIGDVTPEVWSAQLASVGSPLTIVAMSCYKAAQPHTALCLAMLNQESSYAKRFNRNVESNYNPLNLRPPDGDGYLGFSGWTEGIRAWRERLTDPAYDGGVYARTRTIAELIHVYAPSRDDNNEVAYTAGIAIDLVRWGITPKEQQPVTTYQIVGLPGPGIALPVPLAHDIIPLSQSNQRPGIPRQLPGYWVQHETDNHDPNADAAMHNTYLHNGAEGRQASWHFTVDDGVIYQHIPINEVTWQAADGAGPGNMSGISCELCVNAGIDTTKARHNAEALCAGIMKALGLGIDRVKAHYDFNEGTADRHHCPDTMLNDGYWPVTFKANVAALMRTEPEKPKYATPLPITWKEGDYGWKQLNKTPVFALEAEVECVRTTTPLAWADGDSSDGEVAPRAGANIKQGERVKIIGSFAGKNSKGKTVRWLIRSGDNARLVGNSFRPLLPVTQ